MNKLTSEKSFETAIIQFLKITITSSTDSVAFFKNEAKKHNTQYQKMIRRLLDIYAAHHKQQKPMKTKPTILLIKGM